MRTYGPGIFWVRIDDLVDGCLVDAGVAETDRGWVITDLCLSLAPPEAVRSDIEYPDELGPRLSGFAMYDPQEPPQGLTSRHFQQLGVEKIRAAIATRMESGIFTNEIWAQRAADLAVSMSKTRYRRRDDIYYAIIAAKYVEIARTTKRGIYTLMRADLGYAESTLEDSVKEARRRELLTKPITGRAGGELTDKAKQLLESSQI